MRTLPWWVSLVINAGVGTLVSLIPGLSPEIKDQLKTAIIALIMHILGADNQPAAMKTVLTAHACAGIGCAPEAKKL